jgi:Bacterial PH domain/Short C-terminal domain
MARYADTLLADGERIALRTRQHWLATIIDARYPWLILIASLVLLFLSQNLGPGTPRDVLGYAILAGVLIAVAWLIKVYWSWWAQDYMITNRRVLKVEGIINKRSADSSLEKINDAVLEQNLVGRILNYGDLDILTAADVAIDRYRMLNQAPNFKRTMLNEKHELEGEFSRPLPSPPLRAAPATPPAPAGPAPREMAPEEVTRALASLADLRDRGAISPEEYESKKSELLARL